MRANLVWDGKGREGKGGECTLESRILWLWVVGCGFLCEY